MTIAIDARELRTSTGRYIERLLFYLQQLDHLHDYYVFLKPEDMSGWDPTNDRFMKVSCPHKEFTFDEQIGFLRQLNDLQPDLVHFPMAQQPVLYKGKVVTTMQDLTTIRFRNPTKNPVIFTIKQQVYKWVTKRVAKKSVAIITPSEFVKQDVVRYTGISPNKVTVTHLAVDEIKEKEEPIKAFENKQFLMYIGRPQPHKNLHRLIHAFGLLVKRDPKTVLMIAGKQDASYASYEQLIAEEGLQDRVIFTDWISDGQMKWAMRHAAAFVWPSLSEGFGLPPLEAMLYGAPVISSNATCMPEVLGDAAMYFDPLREAELADTIDNVLGDQKLRASLIEKGHQQVKRYDWAMTAKLTLGVYKQALRDE